MSVTAAEVLFRSVGVAGETVRSLAGPGSLLGSTAVNMVWKPPPRCSIGWALSPSRG